MTTDLYTQTHSADGRGHAVQTTIICHSSSCSSSNQQKREAVSIRSVMSDEHRSTQSSTSVNPFVTIELQMYRPRTQMEPGRDFSPVTGPDPTRSLNVVKQILNNVLITVMYTVQYQLPVRKPKPYSGLIYSISNCQNLCF